MPVSRPIDGIKREIAKLGYESSRPWIVCFGRQPEPVRKYEQVMTVSESLLAWPAEVLLPYLERIMGDTSGAGYEWKGVPTKKAQGYNGGQPRKKLGPIPWRKAPVDLGGTLAPEGVRCKNCGRGRAEETKFYRATKTRSGVQAHCTDCQWWLAKERENL